MVHRTRGMVNNKAERRWYTQKDRGDMIHRRTEEDDPQKDRGEMLYRKTERRCYIHIEIKRGDGTQKDIEEIVHRNKEGIWYIGIQRGDGSYKFRGKMVHSKTVGRW
uniref:Uncharacterized protein n=1 Tax=Cacopsylla melanoneura TaxID=428564 RepID=A0A8D8XGC3_9HEMI